MNVPRTAFLPVLLFFLSGIFFLLLYQLEIRPIHHDESVNGWFVYQMLQGHSFNYDPQNYHGPTFFYFAYAISRFFGLELFSIRLVAIIFGCILCFSPFLVRKEIGNAGLLTALLVFATSPACLYYSRYAIHEIILVCFFSFSALSFYRYLFSGQKIFLFIGVFMLGCAAATKETVVIYFCGVAAGLILSLVFKNDRSQNAFDLMKERLSFSNLLFAFITLLIALCLWFDGEDFMDFFRSYGFYLKLGTAKSGHEKPWFYYIMLFFREETLLMLGGIFGAIWAVYKRRAFDIFCLGWGMTVLVIQSFIGYKTPWIILNLMVPFVFLFSSSLNELLGQMKSRSHVWIILLIVLIISGISLRKSIFYSFGDFCQAENPYAYMQTFSRAYDLSNKVKNILDKHKDIRVAFVSPLEWPYPFIFRDYKQISYWKKIPEDLNFPLIVCEIRQRKELIRKLNSKDYLYENYKVRPGMKLDLFIRRDLFS